LRTDLKLRNFIMTMKCVGLVFTIAVFSVAGIALGATVDVPDILDPATSNTFNIVEGTVVTTNNGTVIVFEGELTQNDTVAAVDDGDGLLASTQIYVQMKLFDALPDVTSFTNAQAAVLAVFNPLSTTDGTLYGISGSGASATWMQLTNAATPIAVLEGATNLITIILRYPSTGFTTYEYTVGLSTPGGDDYEGSQNLISPLSTESGINSLSLLGTGGLLKSTALAGDPRPLSSSVDFSVYQSTNGVFLVDIFTVDENGSGDLRVYAFIGGDWRLIGTVQSEGTGSNHYQLPVTGLTVGESYLFKIVDEEDRIHLSDGLITVHSIQMEVVRLTMKTFTIIFNSEDGKSYQLLTSADISAPIESWTVESVQVIVGDEVGALNQTFQGTGDRTQILVPKNEDNPKAFFKIRLLDGSAN